MPFALSLGDAPPLLIGTAATQEAAIAQAKAAFAALPWQGTSLLITVYDAPPVARVWGNYVDGVSVTSWIGGGTEAAPDGLSVSENAARLAALAPSAEPGFQGPFVSDGLYRLVLDPGSDNTVHVLYDMDDDGDTTPYLAASIGTEGSPLAVDPTGDEQQLRWKYRAIPTGADEATIPWSDPTGPDYTFAGLDSGTSYEFQAQDEDEETETLVIASASSCACSDTSGLDAPTLGGSGISEAVLTLQPLPAAFNPPWAQGYLDFPAFFWSWPLHRFSVRSNFNDDGSYTAHGLAGPPASGPFSIQTDTCLWWLGGLKARPISYWEWQRYVESATWSDGTEFLAADTQAETRAKLTALQSGATMQAWATHDNYSAVTDPGFPAPTIDNWDTVNYTLPRLIPPQNMSAFANFYYSDWGFAVVVMEYYALWLCDPGGTDPLNQFITGPVQDIVCVPFGRPPQAYRPAPAKPDPPEALVSPPVTLYAGTEVPTFPKSMAVGQGEASTAFAGQTFFDEGYDYSYTLNSVGGLILVTAPSGQVTVGNRDGAEPVYATINTLYYWPFGTDTAPPGFIGFLSHSDATDGQGNTRIAPNPPAGDIYPLYETEQTVTQ